MTSYGRFISPLGQTEDAAAASTFASLMAGRLSSMQHGSRRVALEDWENEGGSTAASGLPAAESPVIVTEAREPCGRRTRSVMGRWKS
jgi:hypothetical protein